MPILLAAALLLAAAGCSGGSGGGSATTATGAPPATTAAGGGGETPDAAAQQAGSGGEIDWDSYDATGTVTEWNWNQMMLDHMAEVYSERFPNVQYEPLVVNSDDIMTKLQTGLASGSDTPDILLGNQDWRGSLYELGIYEDLESAPYSFDKSRIMPTVYPQLVDSDGVFRAFDQQFSPLAFAYRRDLAEKYFGVSEPDDVAELISTWDKFVAAGEKLASQTSDVYMMGGLMDLAETLMRANSQGGWTDLAANSIDVTARYADGFEKAYEYAQKIPLGKMTTGSTEWHSSYKTGNVIFYNMTTWTSRSYVAGNNPESKGQGLWGVCKLPGDRTGFKGGTSIGICSMSENKESAYALIYYLYATVEGAQKMNERLGYVPSINAFYEGSDAAILKGGFYDDYYKGQNVSLYLFEESMPLARNDQYDQLYVASQSVYYATIAQMVADSSITPERAIEMMKEGVAAKVPGVTVK
jgi:multiple sugar transport system substrate-binding protein